MENDHGSPKYSSNYGEGTYMHLYVASQISLTNGQASPAMLYVAFLLMTNTKIERISDI